MSTSQERARRTKPVIHNRTEGHVPNGDRSNRGIVTEFADRNRTRNFKGSNCVFRTGPARSPHACRARPKKTGRRRLLCPLVPIKQQKSTPLENVGRLKAAFTAQTPFNHGGHGLIGPRAPSASRPALLGKRKKQIRRLRGRKEDKPDS